MISSLGSPFVNRLYPEYVGHNDHALAGFLYLCDLLEDSHPFCVHRLISFGCSNWHPALVLEMSQD